MKPYQRRAANGYPYYKVATWDVRSCTWCDGRTAHPSRDAAIAAISGPGRYRLSEVTEHGRRDLTPFEVGERVGGD